MNYRNIYDRLMKKAQDRTPPIGILLEKHHVIPKSLGGSNNSDNIACLTTREHFIAHLLLVKIHKDNPESLKKMTYALWWMSKTRNGLNGNRVNSWAYDYARQKFIHLNPNKEEYRKERFRENHRAGLYNYDYVAVSNTLKMCLKSLSNEELLDRMKKSVGTCDQQKRALAIKKGKSSLLELKRTDGTILEFWTHEDVIKLTGYKVSKLIYHIKRDSGVLPNGSIIKYISKYTGNDQNIGKKRPRT